MAFELSVTARQLEQELREHNRKTKKAGIRALNKTAVQNRNYSQRQIRKVINVKAGKVKEVFKLSRARPGQRLPSSQIEVKYQAIPVIFYNGARQTRRGVTVKLRKDRPRMLFKHAFIANVFSNKTGAYRRKTRARFPVKTLRGPNVQAIFSDKLGDIETEGVRTLERIYNHELDFIFGRV